MKSLRIWIPLLLLLAAAAALLLRPSQPPGDADARIAFYRERIGDRGTYPSYARLGLAYLQKARETGPHTYLTDAEQHLKTSLGFQRNFEALAGLAMVFAAQHRFREALPLAEEAVAAWPGSPDALGALFDIHLALGDVARAEQALKKMNEADGGSLAALSRAANLAEYRGDLKAALELQSRACSPLRAAPAESRAWCAARLAMLHRYSCDAQLARRLLDEAEKIRPGYFMARVARAELDLASDDADAAIGAFRELIRAGDDPHYRASLAAALAAAGRSGEAAAERALAIEMFRREVASGVRDAVAPLAWLLLESDATAAEALALAESEWLERRDALTADLLAWAAFRNSQLGRALELARRVLETPTGKPGPRLRAAEIFLAAAARGSGRQARGWHDGAPAGAAARSPQQLDAAALSRQARALLEALLACPAALSPAERARAESLK
jgi:hypothetical protein